MKKKVLLVLQKAVDRLLLRNALESRGFEVVEPDLDGPVADEDDVFSLALQDFDILVTEFSTGGLSGGSILYVLQGLLNSRRTAILWSGSAGTVEPEFLLFAGIPREYFGEKMRYIRTINDTALQPVVDAVTERLQ